MVREQGAVDWAAEDFRVLLRLGRTRGHRLWTAGERQVLARVDALGPCGLELLVRRRSDGSKSP